MEVKTSLPLGYTKVRSSMEWHNRCNYKEK
jgi:hypothetical protein